MTDEPVVRVFTTKADTAHAIAKALVDVVAAAVADRGRADVVLTGGSMGQVVVEALTHLEPDWSAVHVWWGDERFLPAGDPDRNDTQAFDAGLSRLGVRDDAVHSVAGPDGRYGDDLEASARAYAQELSSAAASSAQPGETPAVPAFDVLMLGMGPDAHVASLFPRHPAQLVTTTTTVAVEGSPKPPPKRVSLTFPALGAARRVWLLVAGADKAEAVARAVAGGDPYDVPAAGARGGDETVWWLDMAAAGHLSD